MNAPTAPDMPRMADAASAGVGMTDNVYQSLLRNRIIFLGSEVKDENANALCAQMLLLAAEDPSRDIAMYINSPGGVITSGLAMYDTMQFIKPDVVTYCMGQAASMGAFLLNAGAKGKRYCLENARVMIHQPLGGFRGQASDIEIHAREILFIKERLNRLMAEHSGQNYETVARDTDRDNFMTAQAAKEYGLVDQVLSKRP